MDCSLVSYIAVYPVITLSSCNDCIVYCISVRLMSIFSTYYCDCAVLHVVSSLSIYTNFFMCYVCLSTVSDFARALYTEREPRCLYIFPFITPDLLLC